MDGGTRGDGGISHGSDGELRSRVEAVPTDPENEGTEDDERGGVTRHRVDATVRRESTGARSDDGGADQTSDATSHVHDAGTGEIEHTGVEHARSVLAPRSEPALGGPAPVHDDRVHKGGEKEGVSEVRLKLGALSHRTGDDGRRRGGECPLKDIRGKVSRARDALHRKVTRTDEGVRLVSIRSAERETVSKQNQANAPTHASRTFLIKMFFVFCTEPAQSMANPACMKKCLRRQQKVGVGG